MPAKLHCVAGASVLKSPPNILLTFCASFIEYLGIKLVHVKYQEQKLPGV